VNKEQLAAALGVDISYVDSWIERDVGFPEPVDGEWDFAEVETWYQFRYAFMP
jgi:predicted DNA-binding transcriptional regulator AlpA